jgi:hypothetical protein
MATSGTRASKPVEGRRGSGRERRRKTLEEEAKRADRSTDQSLLP